MAAEIVIPRLGWSMEEAAFTEWLKPDGQVVAEGDMMFTLEAEKGTQEIAAVDSGILRFAPDAPKPGDTVRVGQVIGYLLADGEELPRTTTREAPVSPSLPEEAAAVFHAPSRSPVPSRADHALTPAVTPRARRAAREHGVDWSGIAGTGRGGRIRERDVLAAVQAPSPDAPGRLEPITPFRQTLAARMFAAVHEAAPVTLTTRASAEGLVCARTALREQSDAAPGYTDMLIKLAALALERNPRMTAQWTRQGLWIPDGIHIGFAVDTERGLMAPVVRDVPGLTLTEVAAETRRLAGLARQGKLERRDFQGGVFTVTNLGAFPIDAFTPVLNLPQGAILGVGRISREPAVVGEKVAPQWQITLSLTFDHRVHDGVPAARFLAAIRDLVEGAASIQTD